MSIELPQLLQFIFTSANQTVDILYQKLYIVIAKRLHGQAVKTPPFHGGNRGSIPLGVTRQVKGEPVSIRRRIRLYRILLIIFFTTSKFHIVLIIMYWNIFQYILYGFDINI